MRQRIVVLLAAASLLTSVSCSGSGGVGVISGQISVDDAPADVGTVYFRPANDSAARGAGGTVTAGRFELGPDHGLTVGRYNVVVHLSKATGKKVKDPQRGEVPVLQAIMLANTPLQVEITHENSSELQLAFFTKPR